MKMRKSTMFLPLALLSFSILSVSASAQTTEGSTPETVVSEAEQSDEAKRRIKEQQELEEKLKEQASKTKESGGVFKPTEEISEDRPVPFPVDI